MKTNFKLLAILLVLFVNTSFGQDNPCLSLLQDGLYKQVIDKKVTSFDGNLKTYFESQTFKDDFKKNKWNLGIDGVIPVGETGLMQEIGLDFGASEDKINKFQQKIKEAKSIQVNDKFYQSSVVRIPDVGLAKVFTECMEIHTRFGFKVKVLETPNKVLFNISYSKRLSSDPMPTVKNFKVLGSTKIIQGLEDGEKISDEFSISCERYPKNELILSINTDRENLVQVVEASETGFGKEFPIGSIITSILEWNSFSQITEDKASSEWDAKNSKWAPADGRNISASKLTRKTGQATVPDLRGVFLRGLNTFDPFYTNKPLNLNQLDPEGDKRSAGDFQNDELKKHSHNLANAGLAFSNGSYTTKAIDNSKNEINLGSVKKIPEFGGKETRPKNVTVYYYIRIN